MPQAGDQTVIGLLLQLIALGVVVRVMVWMPTALETGGATPAHGQDHIWLAYVLEHANQDAKASFAQAGVTLDIDLAVVALDARIPTATASHHQKFSIIRSYNDSPPPVAFCGGVDLAFTRRDAPHDPSSAVYPRFYDGDWQSGPTVLATPPPPNALKSGSPSVSSLWPEGTETADYRGAESVARPDALPQSDLDVTAYGSGVDPQQHLWHDQHLKLHGPIVATLQWQFCERWADVPNPPPAQAKQMPSEDWTSTNGPLNYLFYPSLGSVWTSSAAAVTSGTVVPLSDPIPIAAIQDGTSVIQMWRTIPFRWRGSASLFSHGEFTVLSGFAHVAAKAQNLIWIFDQYFWSIPYARLLNQRIKSTETLAIVIVIPPYADMSRWKASGVHKARYNALSALYDGFTADQSSRVAVWNLWDHRPERNPTGGWGIYVHAKTHMYDGQLLVCGSANINRRSLLGDTELALAVNDPAVVDQHQRNLWALIFSGQLAWPQIADPTSGSQRDFDPSKDPGVSLLNELGANATQGFLTPDQWSETSYKLPNGVTRDRNFWNPAFQGWYNNIMETSSLNYGVVEQPLLDDDGTKRPPTLQDIAAIVENPQQAVEIGRY